MKTVKLELPLPGLPLDSFILLAITGVRESIFNLHNEKDLVTFINVLAALHHHTVVLGTGHSP